MKNIIVFDLPKQSKYKKCFIVDYRTDKQKGIYNISNLSDERKYLIHFYLNVLSQTKNYNEIKYEFMMSDEIPKVSGVYKASSFTIGTDTFGSTEVPRTIGDYEDVNKWLNEFENTADISKNPTIEPPKYEPPMSGTYEIPSEAINPIDELDQILKEAGKDIKNAAKAGSLFETISVITAELTVGEIIGGLLIIVGVGYGIYKAIEYVNDNINYNGNVNGSKGNQGGVSQGNGTIGQGNGSSSVPERPNKSDGTGGKKETVCVQELDPVTLEPIGNEQCTTTTRPSTSNPNPEGDGSGVDVPIIWDPSRPNGGQKNNKTEFSNSSSGSGINRDEYINWLKRMMRPRFPEPDDYYNVVHLTSDKSLKSSKKQINNFIKIFNSSVYISNKLTKFSYVDITTTILLQQINNFLL
jgi:hypothetical protein